MVKHASLGTADRRLQSSCSDGRKSVVRLLWKHVFKSNDSATVTQRVFRRHFDIGRNGRIPKRQIVLIWVTQFRSAASIVNKKPPDGRPRTVRTPEIVRRVAHAFQRSARRHSIALHFTTYLQNVT